VLSAYHTSFDKREEYKIEYRLRRKDGEYRWVLSHGIPLYSSDQVLQGYIGTCIDIQDKKMMTEALERQVQQRTRELEEANWRLSQYNQQLEQFASVASHDMKEPLRKIHFYNKYISDNAGGKLTDKELECLDRSTSAAKRMGNLIDNLLEYSRVSASIQRYELVDLNEVADEMLYSYKENAEQTGAVITFSSLPVVQGIAFQLRQLLDNLIGNALKYRHPDRKPVIEVNSKEVRTASITGLDPEKGYYEITVRDNGYGFRAEDTEKIFEIFHRLQTISSPGAGVGLAICKKIVQNHHGMIRANAVPGIGACFEIYLPVTQ
jgi:signal transduction histidine kinase